MGTPTPVRLSDPGWSHAVLDFWYRELQPPAWFTRDTGVDDRIRRRFGGLVDEVGGAAADDDGTMASHLVPSAKTALAAVLVLDQFPRNIWRGTPEAFARDPQALAVSLRAIGLGFDRLLRRNERLFLYLPFEHCEDATRQARSVELIGRLGDSGWLDYAKAHRDIIDRFGRFPHRNAGLGRVSTAEEIAFLQTPGSSF